MGRCCEGPPDDLVSLSVDGKTVALAHLGRIVEEVWGMELKDDAEIMDQLMRLTKVYNYVPSTAEEHYRRAILSFYKEVKRI